MGGRLTYFSGFRNPVILLALKVNVADRLVVWRVQEKETGLSEGGCHELRGPAVFSK